MSSYGFQIYFHIFVLLDLIFVLLENEEDSLFPVNTTRKKDGGRRREVENNGNDFNSSNRVIGMMDRLPDIVFSPPFYLQL